MFTRIRESHRILTQQPVRESPFHRPDVLFEDVPPSEETRVARSIGTLVSLYLLSLGSIQLGGYVHRIFFAQSAASAGTVSAALLTLTIILLRQLEQRLHQYLDFGAYLAPFFGRRLQHTQRILKG